VIVHFRSAYCMPTCKTTPLKKTESIRTARRITPRLTLPQTQNNSYTRLVVLSVYRGGTALIVWGL
jgi:hypothetical protein